MDQPEKEKNASFFKPFFKDYEHQFKIIKSTFEREKSSVSSNPTLIIRILGVFDRDLNRCIRSIEDLFKHSDPSKSVFQSISASEIEKRTFLKLIPEFIEEKRTDFTFEQVTLCLHFLFHFLHKLRKVPETLNQNSTLIILTLVLQERMARKSTNTKKMAEQKYICDLAVMILVTVKFGGGRAARKKQLYETLADFELAELYQRYHEDFEFHLKPASNSFLYIDHSPIAKEKQKTFRFERLLFKMLRLITERYKIVDQHSNPHREFLNLVLDLAILSINNRFFDVIDLKKNTMKLKNKVSMRNLNKLNMRILKVFRPINLTEYLTSFSPEKLLAFLRASLAFIIINILKTFFFEEVPISEDREIPLIDVTKVKTFEGRDKVARLMSLKKNLVECEVGIKEELKGDEKEDSEKKVLFIRDEGLNAEKMADCLKIVSEIFLQVKMDKELENCLARFLLLFLKKIHSYPLWVKEVYMKNKAAIISLMSLIDEPVILARVYHRFNLLFLTHPHEQSVLDLLNVRLTLKNKEKSRLFTENLCLSLEHFVSLLKSKPKKQRTELKMAFLQLLPLEKINSFIEDLVASNDIDDYPGFRKILCHLIVFFGYFWTNDSKFLSLLLESFLKKISVDEISKEGNRELVMKFLRMGLKKKRFAMFDVLVRFLFPVDKSDALSIPKGLDFFFDGIAAELSRMNKTEENANIETLRTKLIFICDLITRFTHQLEMADFYNPDLTIKRFIRIEEIFTKQVSIKLAKILFNSHIFENILLLLSNPTYVCKEICFHVLFCTYSILIKDAFLIKFSKESNVQEVWFQFLSKLNEIDPLDAHEAIFILNFLLNLTTKGEYYTRIESKLFCNNIAKSCASIGSSQSKNSFTSLKKSTTEGKNESDCFGNDFFLLNRIDHYDRNKELSAILDHYRGKFSQKAQKFRIQTIWFLDVLIRAIFEIFADSELKRLFLCIIHDLIKTSNYNLAFLANDALSLKLLLFFRFEEDPEVRNKIAAILLDILKTNTKVSHIRIITCILKYPFDVPELMKAANHIAIFEDKEMLKIKARDLKILSNSLKDLFYLMHGIVEFSKSTDFPKETLHFSGNSSGLILKNFNSFPSNSFSIICQVKFENLMPFEEKFSMDYQKSVKNESFHEVNPKRSFYFLKPPHSRYSELRRPTHIPEKDHVIEVDVKILDQKKEDLSQIQMVSCLSKDPLRKYKPRIFSLFSASESILEVFLEDVKTLSEQQASIKLTGKSQPKKNLRIRIGREKCFEAAYRWQFEEAVWYDLVISVSANNKSLFEVFVNGTAAEVIFQSGEPLPEMLQDFKTLNLFSIGCNPPNFLKINSPDESDQKIELSDCLCGELKQLVVLDSAISPTKKTKAGEKRSRSEEGALVPLYRSKNVIMSLDDFSILGDIKMGFDFVWFEIKNKNEIKFLEIDKLSADKVVTLEHHSSKKPLLSRIMDFFSGKKADDRKNKHYNDFKIYTKEVTFIEKTSFFEILFTLGNMEVLFYLFEISLDKKSHFLPEIKLKSINNL